LPPGRGVLRKSDKSHYTPESSLGHRTLNSELAKRGHRVSVPKKEARAEMKKKGRLRTGPERNFLIFGVSDAHFTTNFVNPQAPQQIFLEV
jgi:hypothetical protein